MSTLQVANVVSNGTVVSNTVTVSGPGLTINSTGLFVNSFPFINSSAITVGDSSTNNIIQPTISEPSITVNNQVFTSLELVNVQIFTANGNWTKPSWAAAVGDANTSADLVIVHLWGAGGGGNSSGTGGGGGAFVYGIYMSSQVNSTANVTVGIGGSIGVDGGNTVFGNSSSFDGVNRSLTAYGGATGNTTVGGGGGGWISIGTVGVGGAPLGGNNTTSNSTFGGGGGNNETIGSGFSIYGGGGGRRSSGNSGGGSSIFGGGGGGQPAGTSIYGGFGANSSVAAGYPAGGGHSVTNTTGANGKVIVYTLRKIS